MLLFLFINSCQFGRHESRVGSVTPVLVSTNWVRLWWQRTPLLLVFLAHAMCPLRISWSSALCHLYSGSQADSSIHLKHCWSVAEGDGSWWAVCWLLKLLLVTHVTSTHISPAMTNVKEVGKHDSPLRMGSKNINLVYIRYLLFYCS